MLHVMWSPDHENSLFIDADIRNRCHQLEAPTVIVVGREDVHREAGIASADCWVQSTILEHSSVHKIPHEREVTEAVASEIRRLCPVAQSPSAADRESCASAAAAATAGTRAPSCI